ncbi:MAG: S8 family serine peptidase [Acidimicrobiia bacterium]|nr:S8 family serine peptidase [Acidimicrobiia bacterium]
MSRQRTTFGMTWMSSAPAWVRAVVALMLVLVLVAASALPADAKGKGNSTGKGKPDKGGQTSSDGETTDFSAGTSLLEIGVAIGADELRAAGLTGDGIDVAIIDTGVTSVAGLDAAGKVFDAVDLSFDAGDEQQRNLDLYGHGTAMAGIIAGAGATELSTGIAPGARIVNVKVGAADGTVDVSQVIAGIDWVVTNRQAADLDIRVISLSFGTDAAVDYQSDPLSHAVENAWRHGIVVVVAGGNEGKSERRLGNPALDPYVLSVGGAASTSGGTGDWDAASWSSRGSRQRTVDVIAPGDKVLGPLVPGSYLDAAYPAASYTSAVTGETFLRGSGTSQAAAVTAGAVALLLEAHPDLTPDEVKATLMGTASAVKANERVSGSGMLNIAAAVAAPVRGAHQAWPESTGLGDLDDGRGSVAGPVEGEQHAFDGDWDGDSWSVASEEGNAWTEQAWIDGEWISGTWAGATWTGATWTGAEWAGATWTGATWTGATWTGATWTGATWTGATWTGATWTGATWTGATWTDATWSSIGWE